jgi:serine protease Do
MTQASFIPQEEDKPQENSALGMSVSELSKSVQKKLKIQSGVQVTEVDAQGSARDAGIQEGDVIVMIDNQGVSSVEDFEAITDALKVDKSVALLVQRQSGPVFLAIRPEDS